MAASTCGKGPGAFPARATASSSAAPRRAYACTLYAGDAEESADGAYDRAVTGVKDCLQAGWKTTENVDGVHARTTTAAGATGPSIRVVSRDVSGDAYLVELWVDGTRR